MADDPTSNAANLPSGAVPEAKRPVRRRPRSNTGAGADSDTKASAAKAGSGKAPRSSKARIEDRPHADRTTSPASALLAFSVFALVALLLNSHTLARAADRQPPSWRRTVAVAVTDAVRPVTDALHLDAAKEAGVDLRAQLHPDDGARVLNPTADGDLTVLLVGDSVMEDMADELAADLGERLGATTVSLTQRGVPLGTPELFDWPAAVRSALAEHDPDLVLVMLGASPYDKRPLLPHERGYAPLYQDLVGEFLDAATSTGAQVLWLTRPATGDPAVEAERLAGREPIQEAVEATPNAALLDLTGPLLEGPGGSYRRFLTIDGVSVQMRTEDDVHLTDAGSERVSAFITDQLEAMVPHRGLDEPVTR